MPVKFQDYYEILGVQRNASDKEIRHAYLKLAKQYHPDKNSSAGAEEKFKKIQEAYEVLKDSEKRKKYDLLGHNWKAGQEFTPPNDWFKNFDIKFGRGGESFDFRDLGNSGFSDFFDILFGGSGGGFSQRGGRSARMNQEYAAKGEDLE